MAVILRHLLNNSFKGMGIRLKEIPSTVVCVNKCTRDYSSYQGSEEFNPAEKIQYEVTKNPEEWNFVSRLMPMKVIPDPGIKDSFPSGWSVQKPSALNQPYFVRRTKNHMTPVYLQISYRGMRKLTTIRHIQGDIWLFEKDLKQFLQEKAKREIGTRIDEVSGKVTIKGDHVTNVLEWFTEKGF